METFFCLILDNMDSQATYDDLTWELIVSALQGELSPEEDLQFRQWLASSAANREKYERLMRIWKEDLADFALYKHADEARAWETLRQKMGARRPGLEEARNIPAAYGKRVIWIKRWTTVAAVLLLTAGAGWWYFSGKRASSISYETAAGEQKDIRLPDGSTVVLQPRTRMEVTPGYNKTGRTVLLVGGKAHFEISHQEQRPFTVDMDAAIVKDIGTGFTIEKTKDSIKVTVSGGRIAFIQKKTGKTREISAGGSICLYTSSQHSGEIRVMDTAMSDASALRFDNAPLSQILPVLEKLFSKQILLNDTLAAQKRLTLNLSGESLERALQVICASSDLEYRLKDGKYVLEKKDASNIY